MKANSIESQGRILFLDIARSIAIVSITFNHAVNRSFAIRAGQFAEFQSVPVLVTIIKTILYCFSRIGVPLFVMISGALLLPRNYQGEGTARFIKHNWLQLFITTELWLAIMFWYKQFSPGSILFSQGIWACLVKFIMTLLFLNPITMGSMWYMFMILCVYLMIPILSSALKTLDHKYFVIPMMIVIFCSYILPDLNGVLKALGINTTLVTKLDSMNVFSMHVVYLLLGYFIYSGVFSKIKTRFVSCSLFLAFVAFCVFQFCFYAIEYDFVVGLEYRSIFPMFVAVALFELLRRSKIENGKFRELVISLSKISFGIYFVHICIMEGLNAVITHFGMGITLLWKFIFLESISFFGAIGIISVCRNSRWMSRYLFGIK